MTPTLASPSVSLPDRIAFASDALALGGALVERDERGAFALLPQGLAVHLGVPDELRLVGSEGAAGPGAVAVEFGSPLLERLVELVQARSVAAAVRYDGEPPRPGQARSLAERFVVRNGVHEILEVTSGRAAYASVWFRWTAESDDRDEGLVRVVLSERDGGEPDPMFCALADPTSSFSLVPCALTPAADGPADRLARQVASRAQVLVRSAVAPAVLAAERRYRRDHDRVVRYFEDLAREAGEAGRRRKVDPAALGAKLGHFAADRDAKLAELVQRYSVRVTWQPAAAVRVDAAAVLVGVRIRRRKAAREILLCLPAGASSLDRLACEGCGGGTAAPAVCDEHLHLLCSECAPSAQGRLTCPACHK